MVGGHRPGFVSRNILPHKNAFKNVFVILLCQALSSQYLSEDPIKPITEKTEGQKCYSNLS